MRETDRITLHALDISLPTNNHETLDPTHKLNPNRIWVQVSWFQKTWVQVIHFKIKIPKSNAEYILGPTIKITKKFTHSSPHNLSLKLANTKWA
jgi:hypothetical protein